MRGGIGERERGTAWGRRGVAVIEDTSKMKIEDAGYIFERGKLVG